VFYPLVLVSALSLFALIPLLQQHFFASSDGLYHVYRAIEIGACLEDGAWVCRWAPHQFLGYGTPLFNFYSPFIYYITNVFHALGLDWVNASRAMTALFLVFSAVAAYAYAAEFLSRPAAVLAAVAYVYVPYHLVNAYYRGDLPEFAAMAWFPALLWTFSRLARPVRRRRDWVFLPLAALSYAGLIVTHNLSAFIYTGVLVVYCLWLLLVNRLEGNYRSVLGLLAPAARLGGASALAFGLSAFLSVPALWEKELVTLEGLLYVSHADHFPTLEQIMPNSVVHAYGIIFPDSPVYAYKMGLVQVALGGLGALAAFALWKRFGWRARGEAVISVALFALAFYFTQPPSLWLWDSIPLLPHAQFPWRFLLLMALPTSLMVGYLVDLGGQHWRRWVAPPLVAFVLVTNLLGLKPIMANTTTGEVDLRSSVEFELLYHLMGTTVAGEYIPRTVTDRPFVNDIALAWTLGGEAPVVHPTASDPHLAVEQLERRPTAMRYQVTADRPGRAVFNVVQFPEWRAWLDGQPVEARPSEPHGLISVEVPAGQHTVRLAFENTPLRTWSERFSVACLALTLALLAVALWRPAAPRWPRLGLSRRSALAAAPLVLTAVGLPLGVALFARGYLPPPVAEHPLKIDLDNAIQLLGYDLLRDGQPLARRQTVQAGSTLELAVYWRSLDGSEPAAGSRIYARLSNIDEQQWSQALEESRETLRDGSIVRSLLKLPIPPGQGPGAYQIDVGAVARNGRNLPVKYMELVELLPTQGSVRLGPLLVRSDSHEAAGLRLRAGANFENAVRLDSYDVSRGVTDRRLFVEPTGAAADGALQAAAGDTLQLDLLWRALRERPGHFQISASLLDERGFKWAVRDAEPADGMYPTWMWQAEQPVRDQLRMPVSPETPPGRYRLAVRVLDRDGQPLSVLDPNGNPAGGQANLAEVQLTRSEVPVRERDLRGVTSRERVKINDELEIAAADYGRSELRPGESTDVTLIWRALRDINRDYALRLNLVGSNGVSFGQTEPFRLAGEQNPTSGWEERDYFRGQYRLVAGPAARPGAARLTLDLLDRTTGAVVSEGKRLAEVRVLERLVNQSGAEAANRLDLAFGPAIRLLGYDLEPDARGGARAGETLTLTLHWGAEAEPGKAYTVFTQLLDAEGKLVAQHDGPPNAGQSPTSGWLKGDRVLDEHQIPLPAELPAGEYRLIVGLYDAAGERLRLPDGENHALLTRLPIGR
jgi:hypothetical protein